MNDWRTIDLCGAANIERIVGVYQIGELTHVPGGQFKIKVIERPGGSYLAVPNMCVKSADGTPEWIGGLGTTEVEALQDALSRIMEELNAIGGYDPNRIEWSDPLDFC